MLHRPKKMDMPSKKESSPAKKKNTNSPSNDWLLRLPKLCSCPPGTPLMVIEVRSHGWLENRPVFAITPFFFGGAYLEFQ